MKNLQNLRIRTQKSGKVYYYFDAGGKPRKEIPLGSDYVLAVQEWSRLMQKASEGVVVADFEELAKKYELEVLPGKAKTTQATQRSDLKHLRAFFCNPTPAPLDAITPSHINKLLERHKEHPTTANRLKRLFSHMFNKARVWDYTHRENPTKGVQGFDLETRDVYVSDTIFKLVRTHANEQTRDVMDLAYLTGLRPSDVLRLTEQQIMDGYLVIKKTGKTKRPLRIRVVGEFAQLLERINARKEKSKLWCSSLAVNSQGKAMSKQVLRTGFKAAKAAAKLEHPKLEQEIKEFWFYDLRAKAADDTADEHGEQAAADQLGHASVATTKKHYLRRGKKVGPTK